jgi:hypothetical protein
MPISKTATILCMSSLSSCLIMLKAWPHPTPCPA